MELDRRSRVLLRSAFSAAAVLTFLYFLCWQLNFYLAESLKSGLYLLLAPVLVGVAVLLGRPRGKTEYRLLLLFMLWLVISRVLCGDRALSREALFVLDMSLMLPFLLLGLTLDNAGRRRLLNLLSVVLGLYFFALGLLCITAFLLRAEFFNPITGGTLASVSSTTYFERANILDTNPNATAYWFFMPLSLMLCQFFACRHKILRIPIALSALVDWLAICLTFCRSIRLSCALSFGLLAALLVGQALRECGKALRVLAAAFAFLLVLPISYKCCSLACSGIGRLSEALQHPAAAAEVAAEETVSRPAVSTVALSAHVLSAEGENAPEPEALAEPRYADPRSTGKGLTRLSSERMMIYRAVWRVLREHPGILIRGSEAEEGLVLVNEYLPEPVAHCHNFLLQTLLLTGLPGFALILLFCIFVTAAALRLLCTPSLPLPQRILALPVLSSLLFGQFESGFFNYTDARTLFFYLICGVMLGTYYDCFPARKKE